MAPIKRYVRLEIYTTIWVGRNVLHPLPDQRKNVVPPPVSVAPVAASVAATSVAAVPSAIPAAPSVAVAAVPVAVFHRVAETPGGDTNFSRGRHMYNRRDTRLFVSGGPTSDSAGLDPHRETETQTQTDRQTDREIERDRENQRETETETHTHTHNLHSSAHFAFSAICANRHK